MGVVWCPEGMGGSTLCVLEKAAFLYILSGVFHWVTVDLGVDRH